MKLFYFFLFLSSSLFFTAFVNAQNVPDWSSYSPITKVYPTGEYNNFPMVDNNYVHHNTSARIIRTGKELLVIPPNVRPFPHTATQSTVDANNMGGNSNVIFASWNSFGPSFYGTGFCFSGNAGFSWAGNYQMIVIGNNGDPAPIIWPQASLWAGRLGMSVLGYTTMQSFYSSDNGASWTGMSSIGGATVDKNFSAVDDIQGSPFYGRAYTVWTDFSGTYLSRIVGAYSSNGGASWTGYQPVSPVPAAGHHCQGCDIQVGPGGVVYVVWAHCLTNGQNSTEDNLGFAKSTDGGVTWISANNSVVDINGIRTMNLFNNLRANGYPRLDVDRTGGIRNGWIYAVMSEKNIAPALDSSDITMCRSTDGGSSWTHTKVNQDPGTGRRNFHPAVVVTPDGGVNVSYYDQRNTTGIETEFWLSRSLNGGSTWEDAAVSDHIFTPGPIPGIQGGYGGDYTGITFSGARIFPFWNDNSTGTHQVWTVGVYYIPQPVNDVLAGPFLSLPGTFIAGNNYTIKAMFSNSGTANQTSVPTRFSVDGIQTGTGTIATLPAGAVDSSAFTWNPASQGNHTLRIYSALAVDENRLNDTVTAVVNVLPQGTIISQTQLCRNGLNLPIPQGSSTGLYDTLNINIPNAYNVIDLNVKIDTVLHTYDGDLGFTLTHLSASVAIINYIGGSGHNFINTVLNDSAATPIANGVAPFTGSYRPSFSLLPFNNIPVNGSWILFIRDFYVPNTGTLNAWCLQITYATLLGGLVTIEVPNYYSLSQNYPNPFNPVTTIKYGIPKEGIVTLKVYDILGREISTLVNEIKQPGKYTSNFDASNLASGIYLYKISVTDAFDYRSIRFSGVKKMLFIK
jgi:hypothetical protein